MDFALKSTQTNNFFICFLKNVGDINVVKFLIEHDADINAITNFGFTPLLSAAAHGKLQQNFIFSNLNIFADIWRRFEQSFELIA